MHKDSKIIANADEIVVRVDRETILGNPYHMRVPIDIERNRVCDLYEKYFYEQMEKNYRFRNEVFRIFKLLKTHNVALACWCVPKRCHAETILNYIKNIKE